MDTSILSRLHEIAPDLMQEMELRTLILERVAALGPIGRRALASRLHLAEREVRSAADALKRAGCIEQSAAGMELTEHGRSMIETARTVSRSRRSISMLERMLCSRLNAERVCVVHGDADMDETVLTEAALFAAQQIRFLLQGAHVLAVSGGRMMALTAQAIAAAAPMDLTVVPVQGGGGGSMQLQANTLAEAFAARLGGQSRMLHIPEGVSQALAQELSRLPQVREVMELLSHADVVIYGVSSAQDGARRRGMGAAEKDLLARSGASAEALGLLFDAHGHVVGERTPQLLRVREPGLGTKAALVAAGRSKAEAIVSVCAHHPHKLLVMDEGAANRIVELLRV